MRAAAFAQETVAPEQIKAGSELDATNCSPCRGVRPNGFEMAF